MTSDYKNDKIAQMEKEFIIIRGISGAGKSTLAKQLAGETGQIFSADNYFVDEQGNYKWDSNKIGDAHRYCRDQARKAIIEGISPVIIDNTNVSKWELRQLIPMIKMAQDNKYTARVEEAQTPWRFDEEELCKKNTHGVRLQDIQKMLRKWVPDVTVDDIMGYED